jgi:hypothetical protein
MRGEMPEALTGGGRERSRRVRIADLDERFVVARWG